MSWRWSRAWRICGRSVCPTWSPLQVRAPTSSPRAARRWSMDPWDAKKAWICWWVASVWTGFHLKVVTRNVTLRLITYETDSQTHQIKINHPFKTNTDTDRDTPSDSQCSATPFTVFHNFTSSSFTPMMPCDTAVSHGNPIMTSSHCITFICPAQPWECIFGFPLQSTASCVFVFVRTLVYVPASMPARCCRLIPRISYGDEFTQEHSVPLQHFLRLQEVAVLLLMRDAERLNVAWSMETGQTVIRFTLWCILQWHWPGVLAHRHNKAVFSAHHLGLVWAIQHGLLFSLFFF